VAKQELIIIGAGAAGLMAALELADDFSITILEARAVTGGRIRSHPSLLAPLVIESGAEFIHGKLPLTFKLLKKADIDRAVVKGKFFRKEKGEWNRQNEMIEGWDGLLGNMRSLEHDLTMAEFLDIYYKDEVHAELRRHIISYAEGFDVADIRKAGVKALYEEWSHEEDKFYRIPSGYGSLIGFMEKECVRKGCAILTNQLVKQIDWERGEVAVLTERGDHYRANKAIITIPIPVLQQAAGTTSINFTPALDAYVKAAMSVGTGPVIKVVILFRKRFWEKDMGFVFSEEIFPTWWTQLPDKTPLLTGWVGGPTADRLGKHNEEDIFEKALQSLASIFEKPVQELKTAIVESYVFNWVNDVYSKCAYSYDMPETAAARKLLCTPVENTLFFAGEALYDGESPGTVEAALASGKDAAKKIRKIIG
jgi:monoamine oxidase